MINLITKPFTNINKKQINKYYENKLLQKKFIVYFDKCTGMIITYKEL